MATKIFFIGESANSYMLTSIKKSLDQAGFDVTATGIVFQDSTLQSVNPDIILLMTGDYLEDNKDSIAVLQNYCLFEHKKIDLIGYKNEVIETMRQLNVDCIRGSFERPLNVDEMIRQLEVQAVVVEHAKDQKHILVVDDSGASLRLIKGWLEKKYKVSVASSAAMAIGFLNDNKPDLILLDYEMPICSGPQFLEMIKAEETTANIPVMFLTSKDDASSVSAVLALKPAGYLLKTSPPQVIIDSIGQFFSSRK